MITVNGKVYDGVAVKPDLDEALEHYGVKGMKWRKHLKSALSKASGLAKKAKYKTKNKLIDLKTKYNRYKMFKDVGESFGDRTDGILAGKKRHASTITTDYGTKETGHWDNGTANRTYRNAQGRFKEGIEAGRARRKKKKNSPPNYTSSFINKGKIPTNPP